MNFNSFIFAIFFFVVYALYLVLKHKSQNRMLLVASCLFYSFWDWRFLGLIFLSILVDYFCAMRIEQHQSKIIRKRYLALSIVFNLSVLSFFKYFNFFVDSCISFCSLIGLNLSPPALHILLPVGISFYTFKTMSYTIDVYRKQVQPTHNFRDYALYVIFFPQLVAGPIERAKNLLLQIAQPRTLTHEKLTQGFTLIYWGLFKKVFIADNLGAILGFYNSSQTAGDLSQDGGMILATTYMFLFQLYCDFSAYSDMARGIGKLMGFELMVNFRSPFYAKNIQETWSRWHISLTTWIRDYIYYPLATMKIGKRFLNVNVVVMTTFLIIGLWHGASWNYVLWGGYNGMVMILYSIFVRETRRFRKKKPAYLAAPLHVLSVITTFNVAAVGLLFFRAESVQQISTWVYLLFANFSLSADALELFFKMLLFISPLLVVEFYLFKKDDITQLLHVHPVLRYGFFYLTFYLLVVMRAQSDTFIYFQF
ncbi:MAG: MBOAT family O-acyltransferase [Candidatus Zhuqueibacterota bacterium]